MQKKRFGFYIKYSVSAVCFCNKNISHFWLKKTNKRKSHYDNLRSISVADVLEL